MKFLLTLLCLSRNTQSVSKLTTSSYSKLFYETLLALKICGGHCIVLKSPTKEEYVEYFSNTSNLLDFQDLHSDEINYAQLKESKNVNRLKNFIGGRIALRRATKLVFEECNRNDLNDEYDMKNELPVLRNEFGAPATSKFISGSITHKDNYVAAFSTLRQPYQINPSQSSVSTSFSIGIDLERCTNKLPSLMLAKKILTENEMKRLGSLKDITMDHEVLLIFSFKESVFKALHPILQHSIDFHEIEILIQENRTAVIHFCLHNHQIYHYEASWIRFQNDYWLTFVKIFQSN